MRVDLSASVFHAPDALTDLLNLLRCFAEGRHDLVAEPAVIVVAQEYFAEHAPHFTDAFTELATKGTVAAVAWTGSNEMPSTLRVEAADLAAHTADLSRPTVLVVEDQDSDGRFVRALANIFRADRLLRGLDRGWLVIEHGGGSGSLVKVARSAAARFHLCVRVAALLDSDRLVPGVRTRSHDKAGELASDGVVVHVLELREAENYVPNRVLAACGKPRQAAKKLTLLKQLTPQQRGHFDMKRGFGSAGVIPAEQARLFAGLDNKIQIGLREGFGHNLLHRLLAMSEQLTEQDFASLGADMAAEIRCLLGTIASVI